MEPLVGTVELSGRTVHVRELTVGEIRNWLANVEASGDMVDLALFEEVSLTDLQRMTDLETLEDLAPSQLRRIEAKAREVNGDFFGMRDRLAKIGRAVALPDFPEPSAS